MEQNIVVLSDSVSLSSIFNKILSTPFPSQCGILLGDHQTELRESITDTNFSQRQRTKLTIKGAVKLFDFIPVNCNGFVPEAAQSFPPWTTIGWYSHCGKRPPIPSLKEKHFHKVLLEKLHPKQSFVFLLISSSLSREDQNLSFKYSCFLFNNGAFEKILLQISNIGAIERPKYKIPAECHFSPLGQTILHSYSQDRQNNQVERLKQLASKFQENLMGLIHDLHHNEAVLHDLETRLGYRTESPFLLPRPPNYSRPDDLISFDGEEHAAASSYGSSTSESSFDPLKGLEFSCITSSTSSKEIAPPAKKSRENYGSLHPVSNDLIIANAPLNDDLNGLF